jgi:hypothetical protein
MNCQLYRILIAEFDWTNLFVARWYDASYRTGGHFFLSGRPQR